jgi:hypothetical protein
MKKIKLIKNKCEIEDCQVTDPSLLHIHHIIERTEINCSNDPWNCAILCANHHLALHNGKIKIIGPYPATVPPNNRILVYEIDGIKNVEGIDKPYVTFKNKSFKI